MSKQDETQAVKFIIKTNYMVDPFEGCTVNYWENGELIDTLVYNDATGLLESVNPKPIERRETVILIPINTEKVNLVKAIVPTMHKPKKC